MSTTTTSTIPPSPAVIKFGPFEVTDQVFYKTPLSYALVNHKPLNPGHVLIIPFRNVSRLTDLTLEEVTDLFATVQKVQRMLGEVYFTLPASSPSTLTSTSTSGSTPDSSAKNGSGKNVLENGSFNVALQDGPDAGQSVPHVHVHIIPRLRGNVEGDGIYQRLQGEDGNVGGVLWDVTRRPEVGGKFVVVEDRERGVRSVEVMEKEARMFEGRMREMGF